MNDAFFFDTICHDNVYKYYKYKYKMQINLKLQEIHRIGEKINKYGCLRLVWDNTFTFLKKKNFFFQIKFFMIVNIFSKILILTLKIYDKK